MEGPPGNRVLIFSRLYKIYSMVTLRERKMPNHDHGTWRLPFVQEAYLWPLIKRNNFNSFFVHRARDMGSKGISEDLETYAALGLVESDKGTSSTPRIVLLLGSILERTIVEKHQDGSARRDIITMFHGSSAPNLNITKYLERISKYSKCSPSCFLLAFIYIDRFLQRKDARLTPLNMHRLVITSVMVAAKFWDDECYNNAYYARVGGVSTGGMNRMELKLLFDLDFKLHVTNQVFRNYCFKLEEKSARSF